MNSGGIRIGKLSLRLRGVKPKQAEQHAGSIAREIADSLVRERAMLAAGKTGIDQLSVRVKSGRGKSSIADQIRSQLSGGWPRE